MECDEQIQADDPSLLFNQYVNVLPTQGSRTIRTEEAILIALTGLRNKLKANNEPIVLKESGIAVSSIFPTVRVDSNNSKSKDELDLSKFD